jgi:hypothetical protein
MEGCGTTIRATPQQPAERILQAGLIYARANSQSPLQGHVCAWYADTDLDTRNWARQQGSIRRCGCRSQEPAAWDATGKCQNLPLCHSWKVSLLTSDKPLILTFLYHGFIPLHPGLTLPTSPFLWQLTVFFFFFFCVFSFQGSVRFAR